MPVERVDGPKPRRFRLIRKVDDSGVSGEGYVADGVEFWDGHCVVCWRTVTSSLAIYDSIGDVLRVHGHDGHTEIVWDD